MNPDAVFLAPRDVIHRDIAQRLAIKIIGKNRGHLWEQVDLPFFLAGHRGAELLNLANTAPLFYANNYVTIHDLAFYHHPEWNTKTFSMWYNIMVPRIAHSSRHIFTVSETIKGEIMNAYHIPASKISVTYNGISENMVMARTLPHEKEKIILSVGTFNIRKNHQNLIKAFIGSNIKSEYRLVIVGDRNRVFAEAGLDENDIRNNNITIHQNFSEQELFALYQKAEVVASLSLYEGFGIPILEGLYTGCKILCSDIPVYRELYDKHAIFCNPRDTDEIKSGLAQIVKAPAPARLAVDSLFDIYDYTRSAETIIAKMGTK